MNTNNNINSSPFFTSPFNMGSISHYPDPDPSPSRNSKHPIRIITQNIQGLNDTYKFAQLINFCDLHHIDIMGLAETKLTNRNAKYKFLDYNDNYTGFF